MNINLLERVSGPTRSVWHTDRPGGREQDASNVSRPNFPDAAYTCEPAQRPMAVRLFNGVGRLLRRCGWRRPLCADHILAVACHRTGLDDFGELDVHEPLSRLVESFEGENPLMPVGRLVLNSLLVRLAEARLGVVAALKEHPDVLQQDLPRPVFVLGLHRTGSTLLHRLLAQDPAARALHLWEMQRPQAGVDVHRERRVRRMRRFLAFYHGYLAPKQQAIHPVDAEAPEEWNWLLMSTFRSLAFCVLAASSGYRSWLEEQGKENMQRVYEDYRRQLQLLQWGRPPRRWVLKAGVHTYALDVLLQLFPDACVVQTHRELHEVLPSLCSLRLSHRCIHTDAPDPRKVANDTFEQVTHLLRTAYRARAAHPGRVYDIAYRDLVRDPIAAVRGIYGHFGLPPSGTAEESMRAWLAANPQGKHGRHRYSLEQFGLDKGSVDRLFPSYPYCFGLPRTRTA
jgi:LPS sulfotransferase NodH